MDDWAEMKKISAKSPLRITSTMKFKSSPSSLKLTKEKFSPPDFASFNKKRAP